MLSAIKDFDLIWNYSFGVDVPSNINQSVNHSTFNPLTYLLTYLLDVPSKWVCNGLTVIRRCCGPVEASRGHLWLLDATQSSAGVDGHRSDHGLGAGSRHTPVQAGRGDYHVHIVSRRRFDADAQDVDTAADRLKSHRRYSFMFDSFSILSCFFLDCICIIYVRN